MQSGAFSGTWWYCVPVRAAVSVYTGIKEYIPIMVMYVIIYGFVWIATGWLVKRDEIRINEAIREIQDEE